MDGVASPTKQNPNLPLITSRPTSTPPTNLNTPTGPTPISATTTKPQAELPAPATFDFLPQLHALVSRLLPSPTLDASNGQISTTSGELGGPPLEPQHLATEATALKIRIQRARNALETLPDMDRTVDEQQAEIKHLEGKVEHLRWCLGALKKDTP